VKNERIVMDMHISPRRIAKLAPAISLVALALPASAFGQATRTWVSGTGDDANPCSRTAPCKTFPGAYSKTAAGGEINVIDPGGFGGVTIGKSITIDAENTEGGVLVSGTNGITVNAGPNDKVILRGLDINGIASSTASPGLNGVRVLQAKSVKIQRSKIYGFSRSGVDFEPSNNPAKLSITDSRIEDNGGDGVQVSPPVGGNGKVTIRRSDVSDNACGAVASSNVPQAALDFTFNCGMSATNGGRATINAFHSSLDDNADAGVFSNGAIATVRIGDNTVTGNVNGLRSINSGAILSFQNNYIAGNGTDGSPTGTLTPH
jgi:Right handed beta helix region